MEIHNKHAAILRSEIIEGLGALLPKPDKLNLEITARQLTIATKTCEIKPRLVLVTGQRKPALKAIYLNEPDLESAEKIALGLLETEKEDLAPYYNEIDTILENNPQNIFNYAETELTFHDLSTKPKTTALGASSCENCKEAGIVPCKPCNATGKIKCGKCSGSGQYTHHYQELRSISCTACGGSGKPYGYNHPQRCTICGGSGTRLVWKDFTRQVNCGQCSQSGLVSCNNCIASGKITCKVCKGEGLFVTEFSGLAQISTIANTTFEYESLDGSPVREIKPLRSIGHEKIEYQKISSSSKDIVKAKETKHIYSTKIRLKLPELDVAEFFYVGNEKANRALTLTPGFADGLVHKFLGTEESKSIRKTAKLLDLVNQVPALINSYKLELFSSEIKNRLKTVKTLFAADVYKQAKRKRFDLMMSIWPITFILMGLMVLLAHIPIYSVFGWEFRSFIDSAEGLICVLIVTCALLYLSYGILTRGNLSLMVGSAAQENADVDNRPAVFKLLAYGLFMSASIFLMIMIMTDDHGFGGSNWLLLLGFTALSLVFPSFFIARAFCGSIARRYQKRLIHNRV